MLLLMKYNHSCIRVIEIPFKTFPVTIIAIITNSGSAWGTVPFIFVHHKDKIYESSLFYFQFLRWKSNYTAEHQLLWVLESVLQDRNAAYKFLPAQPFLAHRLSCNRRIQFSFIQKNPRLLSSQIFLRSLISICSVSTLQSFRECRYMQL